MMDENSFKLYAGDGTTIERRSLRLPLFEKFGKLDNPEHYLAERGLKDAVNVALALGQPLLVTGEPGTGKTQLAASIAYELGLGSPLVFNVKTTSTAKDLFYRYDALRHFHDAQFHKAELTVEPYITYEALGLAILLSLDPREADPFLPEPLRSKGPARSVVLIDEIDKAPRDLPNDVLNEIENMTFSVKETGRTFTADSRWRPILVLTSNSEKNSNYDAQFGTTTSGVLTAVTKSGTDQWHGSMYEYARNYALNARQFGVARRPKDIENDFGGSVGGPLNFIPGLRQLTWTGKKKTYFFANYEAFRIRGAVTTPVISVPTAQEKQGDFSDWKDASGNLIPLYDPATTVSSNGTVTRQQFMGCGGGDSERHLLIRPAPAKLTGIGAAEIPAFTELAGARRQLHSPQSTHHGTGYHSD